MKKLLFTLAASMFFCSVAAASPLTDYSQGHYSLDLTVRNTDSSSVFKTSAYTIDYNVFDKKTNLDTMFTLGLGGKFAAQYNYFAPKSESLSSFTNGEYRLQNKVQQINVLYKLNKNVAASFGYASVGTGFLFKNDSYNSDTIYTKSCLTIGILGTTTIAPKINLWGSFIGGKSLTDYKIGIGYAIQPNLDLNVDYRHIKIRDINCNFDGTTSNGNSKGLGLGLTYKY